MIVTSCNCGQSLDAPEAVVNQAFRCPKCQSMLHYVCGESLAEGKGWGDFDGHLLITAGPDRVGEQIFIGGVADLFLGKQAGKHIQLPGTRVSREHCRLSRIDFGPSRWKILDNKSTNGLFVNNQRVSEAELHDGDFIQIGEYQLQYLSSYERDVAGERARALASGASICPSCGKMLTIGAKICVECGVSTDSGRSLVVSKGFDEDSMAERVHEWANILGWLIPINLFPIASEAFGTKKPAATYWILGVTTAVSILFLIATMAQGEKEGTFTQNLLLWSGSRDARSAEVEATVKEIQDQIDELDRDAQQNREAMAKAMGSDSASRVRQRTSDTYQRNSRELSLKEEQIDELRDTIKQILESENQVSASVGFHWYQPITAALLHHPVLFRPFVFHLAGNMIFLFVFGMRVNELIGNRKMAIVYPVLAIGSGLAHHFAVRNEILHPMLGASGAIMGLAGMYFIFFPVQKIHMIFWFFGYIFTGFQCLYKVFRMRGFWLLVLWVSWNDLVPVLFRSRDQTAHWAHLGGFVCGVVIAMFLLLTRMVYANGTDIISTLLGKRAWAILGRPADWQAKAEAQSPAV